MIRTKNHDWNTDRIDVNEVRCVCGRAIARCLTKLAAVANVANVASGKSSHFTGAAYRLRLRCNTGSATVGRTCRNASSNACERGMLNGAWYCDSN